jgi:hypothetical protein
MVSNISNTVQFQLGKTMAVYRRTASGADVATDTVLSIMAPIAVWSVMGLGLLFSWACSLSVIGVPISMPLFEILVGGMFALVQLTALRVLYARANRKRSEA